MARLTEVDVDFISLVKKGANKQKINIYKADDYKPDTTHEDNEQMKGFFDVVKSFFSKDPIEKEEVKFKSFKDRITEQDVMRNIWNVNDTLVSTIRDVIENKDIKDKKQALAKVIEEHGTYLKSKIENVDDIEKSNDGLFKKGDEDLKREEIVEIVTNAIKPLETKIQSLEGTKSKDKDGDKDKDKDKKDEDFKKEDIVKAITDSIDPLMERIEKIENFKGISKQEPGTDSTDLNKSSSIFAGLDI